MTDLAAHEIRDEHRDLADAALSVLLDSSLEPIVDMVLTRRDGAYEALSADGRVRFTCDPESDPESPALVSVLEEEGANPIGNQATDTFSPLDAELAHKHPHRSDNSYPNAYEQIVQLFDAPAAPDLCVLHSARHNWEDQGGHIGEHGSLGVVQARAPWVIAGRGVANLGVVPRAARLVDVAPTIASLLGCAPISEGQSSARFLSRQDGVARDDVLVASDRPPRHVVGFLFDGANPNVLYAMAASG
ncbi:MAG: phosphonoacetate hydrolase, partial [Actinomycetota bacterium]|nr:phosphonoacetate hydrolase [Actinomycetota bacterium]